MSREFEVERQRGRLAKARTILQIAAYAAINDNDTDYDFGDILTMAYDMVEASLNALDSVVLDRAANAQAVADGLRDAAEACAPDQGALKARLEQAVETIESLLSDT